VTRPPSWRAVARVLGERMYHQAEGARDDHDHGRAEADPDNCPFCADRAAYDLYVRKLESEGKR
jgi:hypothetical protein